MFIISAWISIGGRFNRQPLMRSNASVAAKAIHLITHKRVVDRQAFHERSRFGDNIVVIAGLWSELRGLQCTGVAHPDSAPITPH
jgi:hypothetical protein